MASKVSGMIEQINALSGSNNVTHNIASTAYGYCETAAGTAAKVVDMTGFKLVEGVTIHVKFKEKNSASSPTLNVNGTGAKNIVQHGTTAVSNADETSGWYAGAVVSFTYDGTSWVRDQGFNTNSWRGIADNLTSSTATTTSLSAKQGYLLANGSARDNTKLPLTGGTLTGRVTTEKVINHAVIGSGTVGSYTNSTYYPAKWTFNTGMTAQNGDIITIKLPCAGHDYGVFMSIDNGTHYYPVVISGTSRVTTHYPNGGYITVIFNSSGSAANMYALAGQTSSTRITVTGGIWQVLNYYDSGNDRGYMFNTQKAYKVGSTAITAYDLIAEDINGYLVPAHKIAHRVGSPIYIKEEALNANATGSWTTLWSAHYNVTIRKDGNNLSLTTYAPVFLKGTISGGIFTPDTTTPYVSTKANCNVTGAYYMYVGDATSGTVISFNSNHPYYYYDGTNLVLYSECASVANNVAWTNVSSRPTKLTLTGSVTGSVNLDNGELSLATTTNHNHNSSYVTAVGYDSTNKKIYYTKNGSNTDVVTFGSNAFNSTSYLPLGGGTMTGNIRRYYGTASTEPMITMLSNNLDIILWEAGQGGSAATTTTSNHYKLLYKGTGSDSDNSNYLQLVAHKTSDVVAVQIDEVGNVSLPQMNKGSATKPIYLNNGVITEGTAIGASAYHPDSYFALASHGTHVTTATVKTALGTVSTTAKKFLKDTGDWTQVAWGDLTGIPSSFAPSEHEHNRLNGIGRLNSSADAIAFNTTTSVGNRMSWCIYDSASRAKDATNSPSFDASVINMPWDWGAYITQIAVANAGTRIQIRGANHTDHGEGANPRYTPVYGAWREVVTAPKATQMGSATKPIYISNTGQVTEGTALKDLAYISKGSGSTKFLREDGTWQTALTSHQSLSAYAPLASPALTGTPTAPTAANGTNTTQIATTAFVNNTLAYVNAMQFKGTLGTGGTITALPATHNAGDTYRVITAGTWAGKYCEVGTLIICIKDGTAAADADWTSVETNEDGAVIGPTSSTDNAIVRWDGTSGRIIQNSKITIDDNGNLLISHAASATMTADSTNPKITFAENGTQPVHLIYTDYDAYRNPAGLKIIGGASATPAWLEVEGNIYAAAFKGNADTATKLSTNASNTTASFWRGDNTWSDTISGGTLKITNNSNTVTIGSQNGSFTHIYNSASIPFIFNNTVLTTSGNLGSTSYPFNNLYIGAKNTRYIYYVGTKATNAMITFLDNTSDTYGNGIKIGGGGVVVVGAGESANNLSVTAGTENLYLLADGISYMYSKADTIANRIGFAIDTNGHIVPQKAETANNNAQNLGTSDNKWANVYATTFTGNLTGNASTATSWANARKVYVALGTASKTTTINGGASDAAAIALGIDGTLGIDHGGTNATTAAGARANLGTWALVSDSYNTLMPADGTTNGWIKIGKSNTSYGLLPSASGGAGSGHNYIGTSSWYWKYAYIDEIYGHLNGNANTATAIKTAGTTAQFYRGDNSWSNTLTDSLNISKAGAVGIEVDNTQATNPNKVAFIVGSSGNGGIYSRKHAKWIVYADASGNVVLNGNANTATKVGTDSIWLYPESNNKLNFGGTNNSTTIYLGYEAKDSRGIPTKFIFGNSTGTADIQAAKLIGGSGSFTLQWNSTDSSIDFVFA